MDRAWVSHESRPVRDTVFAAVMITVDGRLTLGLEPTQMVLLAITVVVVGLTVVPGRAEALQCFVHLVLFATLLFLSMQP